MKLILSLLVIALSSWILWHFLFIWVEGSHWIGEPNIIILTAETVFFVAVLSFGCFAFVKAVMGK